MFEKRFGSSEQATLRFLVLNSIFCTKFRYAEVQLKLDLTSKLSRLGQINHELGVRAENIGPR